MDNHTFFDESVRRFIVNGETGLGIKGSLDLGAASIEYIQELLWPIFCMQIQEPQWLKDRKFVIDSGNYLCALYKKAWEEMGFHSELIVANETQDPFIWGVSAKIADAEEYIHFPAKDFINILTEAPSPFPVLVEQFIPLTHVVRPISLYAWSGLFLCSHWAEGFWNKQCGGIAPRFLETVKKWFVADYIRSLTKGGFVSSKGALFAKKVFPLIIWPDDPIKDLLQYHLDSYKESEDSIIHLFRKEIREGNEAAVLELLEAMVEFPVAEFRVYGRIIADVLRYPEISALYKESASFWRSGSIEETAVLAAKLRTLQNG